MNTNLLSAANYRRFFATLLPCFLAFHAMAEKQKVVQELADANSNFAFNLLRQLALEQPQGNIFISPYSASTALQMVSTGAAGKTLQQMQRALGTSVLPAPALSKATQELGAAVNRPNTNFILNSATALWCRAGFPVLPSFVAGSEREFGAQVSLLNFNLESSVDVMNTWAARETRGKISQIVSGPIDPSIRMYLANAVYFLGNWQNPFDTNLTTDRSFQRADGSQTNVSMMHQTGSFGYAETGSYQAVRLPYNGGGLAMYVFLPSVTSSVQDLLTGLDTASWQQSLEGEFSARQGTVALPKFSLNYAASLVAPLQKLGMTDAFNLAADFMRISRQPLYISEFQQQAAIDVNEVGTEAAAVTTVGVAQAGVISPQGNFDMNVNRPFLFVIEDEQVGAILFAGMVQSL